MTIDRWQKLYRYKQKEPRKFLEQIVSSLLTSSARMLRCLHSETNRFAVEASSMRRKDESKKVIIAEYINRYFDERNQAPSVRDIVAGTGIALATVHRYLVSMQ